MGKAKVQYKAGLVDTGKNKRNSKSVLARKGHGDAHGVQIGVSGSGHIKKRG